MKLHAPPVFCWAVENVLPLHFLPAGQLLWKPSPKYLNELSNARGKWNCLMKARCCPMKHSPCCRRHLRQNLWMCAREPNGIGLEEFRVQSKSNGNLIRACAPI